MQTEEYLPIEHNGSPVKAPVVLPEGKIERGVRGLAEEVARWCARGPLEIVSILHGAKPFTEDLGRHLADGGVAFSVHEVKVSNTAGTVCTGDVRLESGALKPEKFRGRRALIVDDIIDSGATVNFIKGMIEGFAPAEVRVAAVVNKYARHSNLGHFVLHDLKFAEERTGVDHWLFGYGMDLNGKYRELRSIGWVEVPVSEGKYTL